MLEKQVKIKGEKERKAGKQKRDNKMAARMRTLAPAYLIVKAKIQPPNARTFYYATYCELYAR